jgi:hypothetical protein
VGAEYAEAKETHKLLAETRAELLNEIRIVSEKMPGPSSPAPQEL